MRFLPAAVVIAAVACAHRGADAGRVGDPSAPARGAFEIYPADQVAAARNPHDHGGKPLCQRCHAPDLKLTNAPNALCRECHRFSHGNHPVDVVQKTPAPGLPLIAGGKVACHTCHDPHQRKVVLRRSFDALCRACHKGH
ncbi:MAG TPA: cytochrome c3 family protein [Anaeromyxobacter sp.]